MNVNKKWKKKNEELNGKKNLNYIEFTLLINYLSFLVIYLFSILIINACIFFIQIKLNSTLFLWYKKNIFLFMIIWRSKQYAQKRTQYQQKKEVFLSLITKHNSRLKIRRGGFKYFNLSVSDRKKNSGFNFLHNFR